MSSSAFQVMQGFSVVSHFSSISTRMAVTRRSSEASLGKTLTFTVRRLISCWMDRSMGFEVRMRFWWRSGRAKTARPSGIAVSSHGELGGAVAVGRHQMAQLPRRPCRRRRSRPGVWPFGWRGWGRDGWRPDGTDSAARRRRRGRPCARRRGLDLGNDIDTAHGATRVSRKARQCTSASESAQETPSTRPLVGADAMSGGVAHHATLSDFLIARVEEQVADLAQRPVAPGIQLSGGAADLARRGSPGRTRASPPVTGRL